MNTKGRVTIPTDMDAVPETLDLLKRWGADAIRDCDGTEFPQELKDTGAKIYATYYTTRKDNAWAKANPDETQQCYIMTPFSVNGCPGSFIGVWRPDCNISDNGPKDSYPNGHFCWG